MLKRECITLFESRLHNPHRKKRIETRTPIPLVHVTGSAIIKSVKGMRWEVLEHCDPLSFWQIHNWLQRCRKHHRSWFRSKREYPIFPLGFQWTRDTTGRFQVSYWLEYSVEKKEV